MSVRARLFRFPAVIVIAIVLGVALCLPVLRSGFFADDYLQLLVIEGRAGDHSRLDLYRFTGRDAAESAQIIAQGPWPWFWDPEVHVRFFRPLSSALLLLDHSLFGAHPTGYHAHTLLWYAALVAAAAALYRRTTPEGVGALALILFAIDDAHGLPVAWLASRHALVAAVPAMLGLLAHIRAREDGWRPGRWLGVVGFGVGLAGGETAAAMLAYVFAYEALGHPAAKLRDRARAVAPHAALALAYLGMYKALGYGARGSAVYLDAIGDPARYAAQLPGRLAALSGGQILGAPGDLWMFDARAQGPLIAMGVLGIALLAWLLRSALRAAPEEERRPVRWWLAGAVLSMLATASGSMSNRLLLAPSLGAFVAIAFVLRHAWRVARRRVPAGRASRVAHAGALGLLVLVHFLASPLLLLAGAEAQRRRSAETERIAAGPDVVPAPGAHVIVLATANRIVGMYGGAYRMFAAEPRPAGWHVLSMAPVDHRLTRTGPRTLELAAIGGVMFQGDFDEVMRRPDASLSPGHEVALDCGRVRVLEAPGGRPTRIELTLDGDLAGQGFSFVALDEGAFRRVPLPEQGSSVVIGIHPQLTPF